MAKKSVLFNPAPCWLIIISAFPFRRRSCLSQIFRLFQRLCQFAYQLHPAVCQKMWKFNIENAQSHGSWPQSSLPRGCQSIDWQGQVVCDSWQLLPAGCHRLNLSSFTPLHFTPDSNPGWSPPRDAHRTVVTNGWLLMVLEVVVVVVGQLQWRQAELGQMTVDDCSWWIYAEAAMRNAFFIINWRRVGTLAASGVSDFSINS